MQLVSSILLSKHREGQWLLDYFLQKIFKKDWTFVNAKL